MQLCERKIFGFGMTTLMVLNEEMNNIMKIVKSLKKSGLMIKDNSETIKNEERKQKEGFIRKASLLGNPLTAKGTIRAGEGTIRADQDF